MVKREETNIKVSKTMLENGKGFPKGYDPKRFIWPKGCGYHFTNLDRTKGVLVKAQKLTNLPWNQCSSVQKAKRVRKEQNGCCFRCEIKDWMQEPISLELHHIRGPKFENREDLCFLCPNCHSQTPNYRNKGKKIKRVISDTEIIEAVKTEDTLGKLLRKIGLVPKGGNYATLRSRLTKLGLLDKYLKWFS